MTNYYEILGLSQGAGHAEIKTAFRRLAKQYHPDRNPGGREHFNTVLKAYETLSDPIQRSTYDYKLNYHLGQNKPTGTKAAAAATTKNWSFEEKEMKHRQYFNEHYKKNNKTTAEYTAEVESKASYNEYKYILFATPIAVALFLLIMNLAMPDQPRLTRGSLRVEEPAKKQINSSQLSMGDAPYTSFFGGAKYDPASEKTLTVENKTGKEAIVCLFTKAGFVRSFYIQKNYFAEASQLPDEPLFMRYSTGLYFKHAAVLKDAGVSGAFTQDLHFFKGRHVVHHGSLNAIALQEIPGKNFKEINETEFFKTTK